MSVDLLENVGVRSSNRIRSLQSTQSIYDMKFNDAVFDGELRNLGSRHTRAIGVGSEAIIFHNSINPVKAGVVNKWLRDQHYDTHHNAVIQYLIQGNALNNPHVPKVYDIRRVVKENKRGHLRYDFHIKMEKLAFTMENANTYIDRLQFQAITGQVLIDCDSPELNKTKLMGIIYDLVNIPSNQYQLNSDSTYEVNPKLLQTIRLINSIGTQYNACNDMHANNAMIRLTSVGMQLVINDPLSQI